MEEETTVSTSYVFRGIEYIVTMSTQAQSLTLEVEDRLTADQWRATFDSAYIEDLTHKTGNFKQFHIFNSMLESAVTQSSDSVSLDLLTYSDLESLRQRKTNVPKSSIPSNRSVSVNSKRYLILTYTVEFDRIHYPLPIPYMGKPDPRRLQETIRQLREELKAIRQQGGSDFKSKEMEKLQRDYKTLLKEKEEIEAEFLQYRREMKNTSSGNAIKEIRVLKTFSKSLEEELMKEKTRHQRSASKRGQEYRELLEEVEELRASERNLHVRVKSLTNELAMYKRDRLHPPVHHQRSSRPSARDRFPSRERSVSRERSLSRDRSWSSDRLSVKERSLSRDRDRPSSAPNRSRNSSYRNSFTKPRSRTPSPSPAGARNPRFDPSAYIKDQEQRKTESRLKKQRQVKSNLSGCSNRSKQSPSSSRINSSRLSAASSRNRSRTSSFGSVGELSDGGMSDSSYSRLRTYNKNYTRNKRTEQQTNPYLSSPDVPQKTTSRINAKSRNHKKIYPYSLYKIDILCLN
ncbi:Coiled-coil domain-containing protein 61 [Mizuhopecten yessoensis]|uniref:Centrosomal protein CCDC61 n=1 Tax=Mizuhopecten yessoensis TaxID=6573 RepID=A0A210QJF8_MIZYE|nr:Coiled-coil domain-containing protein 61 [Mizuhopecten yessoensis]